MSYILDALRRADAERERDPGRGIHAQPVPLPAENGRRMPLWIAAAVVALVLLVAGALLLRPAPRVSLDLGMPPPNARVAAPVMPPPATPAAPVAPPAPAAQVIPPAPPAPPEPERAPARPVAKAPAAPSRAERAAPAPAPAPAPAEARRAVAAPTPAAPAAKAPAPATAAASDRIMATSELPPDVQRELPKLQVSGGVYSDNPAQRLLIVGGQVIGEGAEAAPGVLVEQIRPKSAVLKFHGWRYSVQY